MELLFVTLGGLILGFLARYALPHRSTSGVLLVPAIGAAFSAALWVALTWAGLAWDAGVIWWVTLAATAAVCAATAILLGRARERHDVERLATLTRRR
jgi:quaternary ammonium compound-resistance protein SugE